jgi:hypothetical protein
MCINHYEYAKGPSRIIRSVGHEDIDMDIDPGATGISASQPQDYSFMMDLFEQGVQQSQTKVADPVVTTSTTTIFTPGIDNTRAAMEIKGVADNLLGATGAVLGGAAGVLSGRPALVYTGVKVGDAAGRKVGSVMWDLVNANFTPGRFFSKPTTSRMFSGGQDYSRQRY